MSETIAIFERCTKDQKSAPHWHHVATVEDVEDVQDLTPPEDVDPGAVFTFVVIERDGNVISDINDWPSERLEYGYLDFATSPEMQGLLEENEKESSNAMTYAIDRLLAKVHENHSSEELHNMSPKEVDGVFSGALRDLIDETVADLFTEDDEKK